jgi:hypothetical protein
VHYYASTYPEMVKATGKFLVDLGQAVLINKGGEQVK